MHDFFLQSTHQVDMKNVVKCLKYILRYSTTLETYCVTNLTTGIASRHTVLGLGMYVNMQGCQKV